MSQLNTLSHQEQQKLFISTLTDLGGSQYGEAAIARRLLDANKNSIGETYAVNPEELIYDSAEHNCYIAYNRVKIAAGSGYSELNANNIYALTSMYFDLDCADHVRDEAAIGHAIEAIKKAVSFWDLPQFTFIVDSGNGIGLYYKLKHSVAASRTKMVGLYDFIYKFVADEIEKVLKDVPIELDRAVIANHAGLCRVPGTFNIKAQRYAEIVEYNDIAFELDDFKRFLPARKSENDKAVVTKTSAPIIPITSKTMPWLFPQLKKFYKLQDSRDDWHGYHQVFCHLFFNTARGCMPIEEARAAVDDFNANFNDGGLDYIRLSELKRRKRFYPYGAKKIASLLGLSDAERREFGFNFSGGYEKRNYEAHVVNQSKKHATDRLVVDAIRDCKKYQEVVEVTGVSIATVKRIAKRFGVTCKSSPEAFDAIQWDDALDARIERKNQKSIKKCTDGVDVTHSSVYNTSVSDINLSYALSFVNYLKQSSELSNGYQKMVLAFDKYFVDYLNNETTKKRYQYVINSICYIASCYESSGALSYAIEALDTVFQTMQDDTYHVPYVFGSTNVASRERIKAFVALKPNFYRNLNFIKVDDRFDFASLGSANNEAVTIKPVPFTAKERALYYYDIKFSSLVGQNPDGESAYFSLCDLIVSLEDCLQKDALKKVKYMMYGRVGASVFNKICAAINDNKNNVDATIDALCLAFSRPKAKKPKTIDDLCKLEYKQRKLSDKQREHFKRMNEHDIVFTHAKSNSKRSKACRCYLDLYLDLKNHAESDLYGTGSRVLSKTQLKKYLFRINSSDMDILENINISDDRDFMDHVISIINPRLTDADSSWMVS